MSKQTKKPSFGDDLDMPAPPLTNDARLYGVNREVVLLPQSVVPADTSVPPAPISTVPTEEEWLKFSTFLRRSTYVRLKQSEYWDRLVLKKAVDSALCAFLDAMDGADRPLPEAEQYRLNGKKLK
ncbi:hypothetical protein GCM10011375_40820 [Hymenobacter qilianensis]|uniref:Uncharacterized protein n=2 Tax=Hymenobacter qilianensis TaxID=1385715 RepID=A0ACB5PXF1_9BACT|nr:hypothetical protein [Hymenobacter qilianensis]QNP54530.1 hypothetical protein H9L05_22735 [Hymenobacter qilianensis]GGF81698.1 hypothetical protein GCM10011375_40820 [Hymenobacter qilianensis]